MTASKPSTGSAAQKPLKDFGFKIREKRRSLLRFHVTGRHDWRMEKAYDEVGNTIAAHWRCWCGAVSR